MIGLETNSDSTRADKALGMHSYLISKHGDMLNNRQLDCAQKAFIAQKVLNPEPEGVFHSMPPKALLFRWYSINSERRTWRQDFLKNICKAFEFEPFADNISRVSSADCSFLRA